MPAPIELTDVSRRFGAHTALAPVSLQIPAGQFVALLGPSGCGKTTLLRLVADLDQPSTGQVRIGGQAPAAVRRQRRLGLVSQRPAVLPWKRAIDDVRFTQQVTGRAPLDAAALLRDFGLGAHTHKAPHELSGGMLQRVAFASAIAHDPDVLLMDEPFSALDEMTREELGLWLAGQLALRPKTVLFVTHHVDEAVLLADRVIVLSGSPGRVLADLAIDTPRPRDAGFRGSAAFLDATAHIRALLFGPRGEAPRPAAALAGVA